jgi:ribonuclease J
MSKGEFLELTPEAGDLVLLSSRPIPGNERRVMTMVNDFSRRDVRVKSWRDEPELHVSGHASRDELSQMIRWIQPKTFIPVHGTLHHLRAHEAVAKGLGIPDTRVVENGQTVRLFETGACVLDERVQSGLERISKGGRALGSNIRRRRGELARGGVVFVSVRGRVSEASVLCSSLGIVGLDDDETVRILMTELVRSVLEECQGAPPDICKSRVRRQVRSFVLSLSGERPRVELHLV